MVHISFGPNASSPGVFLPLPGILLTALIPFLDSESLGHLPLLQPKVGEKQNPPPVREPEGPSIFIPAGKPSPPGGWKPAAPDRPQTYSQTQGCARGLCLEETV